ncbi:copper resistance protein CopQ [Cupriavidus pampae]|uniref:Copper resistance protein CopQ n=1 Tax=Cupriavidus pampae TaxID=659251 RepID=A0ABM8WVJ2_9BURK|nr:copper resistance protein CopQ [Cupriavidus pampae]CAG9171535.1 hypothetical protein LMG32289_02411 [Cupriavidus pampae]
MNAKTILTAAALAAAFIGGAAQAAQGSRDPYLDGARTISEPRSTYTDGARISNRDGYTDRTFDTFTDGARVGKADPFTDGARIVAGLDRTGVSAEPSRKVDPYLDGARDVRDQRSPFYDGARQRDVYSDGARTVAGLDRTGVSAEPSRKFDVFTDGANA